MRQVLSDEFEPVCLVLWPLSLVTWLPGCTVMVEAKSRCVSTDDNSRA
jgi:hypothetical protein